MDAGKLVAAMCPPLVFAAAAACGGAGQAATQRKQAIPVRRANCAAATPRTVAAAAFARGRYRLESNGAAVRAAAAVVAADPVLADAVRKGALAAADAEAGHLVAGHQHITAIRVRRAGAGADRVFVETHRYPFDVAGASATLRDRGGAGVGTVEVTIQDVIGFIRLVHKFTGSDVVARGAEARATLPAALAVPLPATGCVDINARSYAVREFSETDFAGRPLRIWVLRDHR